MEAIDGWMMMMGMLMMLPIPSHPYLGAQSPNRKRGPVPKLSNEQHSRIEAALRALNQVSHPLAKGPVTVAVELLRELLQDDQAPSKKPSKKAASSEASQSQDSLVAEEPA